MVVVYVVMKKHVNEGGDVDDDDKNDANQPEFSS